MWKEFRTFVARGNFVDLAVGVVIGAAFTTVVNSFVRDILMPPIGLLTGGIDFSELYINLSDRSYETLARATEAGAPTINYGVFLTNLVSFLLVSLVLFLFIRQYNRLRTRQASEPAEPTDRECPRCRFRIPLSATRCAHCTTELESVG